MKNILLKIVQIFIIILLGVAIVVILKGIYSRIQDERTINKGVEALKSEMQKFDQENSDLNKLVEYFNSTEFQEKEIREKLNLVKDGERVVLVQGGGENMENNISHGDREKSVIITSRANYYHWWEYFFGDNFNN